MNLQRILTNDYIIDSNTIKIFLPDEIDLSDTNDYFELIIYKLDGIFSYSQLTNNISTDNSIIIDNTLSSTSIDSILRDKNGNRILFYNRLNTDENNIEFVNYNNNINDIIIYTNEFTERYQVTPNDTDNIHWETDNSVEISHSLSGDVNIILRNIKDNSMFKYSDYKLADKNGNKVLIVFPEDANIIKDFTIDIYLIYTESNNYGTLYAKEISAGKYISDITYNNYQDSFDALIQFINANKNDSDIIDLKNEQAHIILKEPNNRYIDYSQMK